MKKPVTKKHLISQLNYIIIACIEMSADKRFHPFIRKEWQYLAKRMMKAKKSLIKNKFSRVLAPVDECTDFIKTLIKKGAGDSPAQNK